MEEDQEQLENLFSAIDIIDGWADELSELTNDRELETHELDLISEIVSAASKM